MPIPTSWTRGFVYFVQSADGVGPIKIGFAQDVDRRLAAIQTGSPVPLRVIAFFAARRTDGTALHQMFREHRLHGEWFIPVPELVAIVDQHRSALAGEVHEAEADETRGILRQREAQRLYDQVMARPRWRPSDA
jgi:hypothetical protein